MARYTGLTSDQALELARAWCIAATTAVPVAGGSANSSYRLEVGGRHYVLTVLDNHDVESAKRLVIFTRQLEAARLQVPHFKLTADGNGYVVHDGRPVVLKRYVCGTVREVLGAEDCVVVGRLLGALHSTPIDADLPTGTRRLPPDFAEALGSDPGLREYVKWLTAIDRDAQPFFANDRLPRGVIHGDVFPDNLVFTSSGQALLLDWETASHDLLVLDIAMSVVGLCRRNGQFLPGHARALITGYRGARSQKWTKDEQTGLRELSCSMAAVIGFHRALRHRIRYPNSDRWTYHLEMPPFVQSLRATWPAFD